jgi:hypothetical protein
MTEMSTSKIQETLKPCPKCGTRPSVSENNVPGNWYGYVECGNLDCEDQPSICYGGEFSAEAVDEWNALSDPKPEPDEATVASEAVSDGTVAAFRKAFHMDAPASARKNYDTHIRFALAASFAHAASEVAQ